MQYSTHTFVKQHPLTATMCRIMAPLFRSLLVKASSGNSCIAGERGNVRVTTHQQCDREAHAPSPDFKMGVHL